MCDIQTFDPSHYDAARALWLRSPGIGLSSADDRAEIQRFLARNPGLSLVALSEGMLVATILVGHDGRRGLIHHLAVDDGARRRGLGRRLVGQALQRLGAAGIAKCHLLVFEANEPARAFWAAIGAEHRLSLTLYSLATNGPH